MMETPITAMAAHKIVKLKRIIIVMENQVNAVNQVITFLMVIAIIYTFQLYWDILLEQLYKPVRWIDSVREMHLLGVTKIIECGPGKVLCGLIKKIESSFELFSIHDQISIKNTLL